MPKLTRLVIPSAREWDEEDRSFHAIGDHRGDHARKDIDLAIQEMGYKPVDWENHNNYLFFKHPNQQGRLQFILLYEKNGKGGILVDQRYASKPGYGPSTALNHILNFYFFGDNDEKEFVKKELEDKLKEIEQKHHPLYSGDVKNVEEVSPIII